MRAFALLFALVAAAPFWSVSASFACSCAPFVTPTERIEFSDAIFLGVVKNVSKVASHGSQSALFEVRAVWKGKIGRNVSVTYQKWVGANCGMTYFSDQVALIFAVDRDGFLVTNSCLSDIGDERARSRMNAHLKRQGAHPPLGGGGLILSDGISR